MEKKLSKIGPEFWKAWKEKFWSLLVSAKMIMFFGTLLSCLLFLRAGYLTPEYFAGIIKTLIITVAGFRGIIKHFS